MDKKYDISLDNNTEKDKCGCGHDHSHSHEDYDHKDEKCGCGHDHDSHSHDEEGCGCGGGDNCGCSNAHDEEDHEDGCGCGHDHGEIEKDKIKPYIIRVGVAIVMLITSLAVPFPDIVKTIIQLFAYAISGYEIIFSAFKGLRKLNFANEDFLMTIATIGAIILGDFSEAVAVMVFFGVGEILEQIAVANSKKSITQLMNIKPSYANVIRGSEESKVLPSDVNVGETILIKVGEKIPLDGIVTKGTSSIDTSSLTGESLLKDIVVGDTVLSGAINWNGVIEVKTTSTYDNSTVAQIIKLLENSQSKKSASEKLMTKFAKVYTPAVLIIALVVAFGIPIFTGFDTLGDWVYKALSFLIISCPCALVVSIPMTFFAGIGSASKKGILVKGGNYLEKLNTVKTIVLDKTGTLTTGRFKVSGVYPTQQATKEQVLQFATIAEKNSNHPIAQAVLNEKVATKGNNVEIVSSEELAGRGVKVVISGNIVVVVGNLLLMEENDIYVEKTSKKTCLYVGVAGKHIGYIEFEDEIKATSKGAIEKLRKMGVQDIVMLSGDTADVVVDVANKLGITSYFSKLLPQDKVEKLTQIIAKKPDKSAVMFVGDGINDAPVLALSDIGVAMGQFGSEAAGEAADIVLANDDIGSIAVAMNVAKRTRLIVTQNIIFALGMKLAIVILAIFGITSLWFAILADVGVALIAITNSVRAGYIKS